MEEFSENNTKRIMREIGKGHYGRVYMDNDIVIKKYMSNSSSRGHIDYDVFNELREIDEKAFIRLFCCEYIETDNDPYTDKIVTSYSSKYISGLKEKSIDLPIDYTLNSLYELKKLVERLNDRYITIGDTDSSNIIVSNENLVVVDPDHYFFSSNNTKHNNLVALNEYLLKLWQKEYGFDEEAFYTLDSLFFYDNLDDYLPVMKERLNEETPRKVIEKRLRR